MPMYRFDQIAINSTEKKKPVESDKDTYLGLEHLDAGILEVTRFGAETAPKGEKLVMHKGDVLFGKRRAYQKKVAIAPFDGIFSAHGMVLRPNEDVVDKAFFPFFISSDYFLDAAIKISVGSLSPTINWRDLRILEFELPSKEKQRRLAEILWAMNDTKKTYRKLLTAADDLTQAQLVEMIRGAEYKTISEVALKYGRGKSPKYVEDSQIKVINQACIYWDGLRFENVKYQDPEKFNTKNVLKPGAVLINATGTGTLGRSFVFPGIEGETFMADSHVMVVDVNEEIVLPRFIQVFLSLPDTQNTIYTDCVNGSTNQIELSKEAFGNIKVPVVDMNSQKIFVDFVEKNDQTKLAIQESMDALIASQQALMRDHIG